MIYRRLVFKDLMQHTRARCSLPARGAVHPTQDSAVFSKKYLNLVIQVIKKNKQEQMKSKIKYEI